MYVVRIVESDVLNLDYHICKHFYVNLLIRKNCKLSSVEVPRQFSCEIGVPAFTLIFLNEITTS